MAVGIGDDEIAAVALDELDCLIVALSLLRNLRHEDDIVGVDAVCLCTGLDAVRMSLVIGDCIIADEDGTDLEIRCVCRSLGRCGAGLSSL